LLNLRALRVSLASALVGLPPDKYPALRDRANALLEAARQRSTDPEVLRQIEALQAEWDSQVWTSRSDSG
jgi:hypothetical protein